MAYTLKCAEAGTPCKFEATTETKEELLKIVKLHMETAHPEMAKNPPPPAAIERLIHKV